jgi:periplasmic divalent cation tolerance protein
MTDTLAEQTRGVIVYVPVPVYDNAVKLGRTIVEEHLAGSVNVLAGATSYFWWKGELNERGETILLFETVEANVPALIERVKELHSYVVPGIGALPIVAGNPDWLHWLAEAARPATQQSV